MTCGDLFNCHRSTVCRKIPIVLERIALLLPSFIKMPTTQDEIKSSKSIFYRFGGFPGVIGAIGNINLKIFK